MEAGLGSGTEGLERELMKPFEFAVIYLGSLEVRKFYTKDEMASAIKDAKQPTLALKFHISAQSWSVMEQVLL